MAHWRILSVVLLSSVMLTTIPPIPVLAADESADPLEPLAWTVGGRWVADIKGSDDSPLRVEATFRRSAHKKAITYDVVFKSNNNSVTQYEGMYFWHPGKKTITLMEVTAAGATTEGALKPEGTMLVQRNLSTQADGTTQDQRVELVRKGNDAFAFEAFLKKDDQWVKAVGFTYNRVR
jgi:hypothetical protein